MKIIIDNPCQENWNNMTPNQKGAFCSSCCKNVIDFSTKTINEIKVFFTALPESEKVCGRFKEDQLKEISFDHFFKEFKSWKFLHKTAVILFFVFGTSLFSGAQTNLKNEPRILKGDVAVSRTPSDTVKIKPLPEPKTEIITMGEPRFIANPQPKTNPKHKELIGKPAVIRDPK